MKNIAVAVYGPPGAGKGTMANFLAEEYGFVHFDTGKRLRGILYAPENQDDPVIAKERELNESGVLNTPSWVLEIVKNGVKQTATAGLGIVFSGSPRTLYEAFGDEETEGLTTELSRQYGKENIFFVFLKVRPEVAQKRNAIRLVCTECKTGVSGEVNIEQCPICLGNMQRRKDDNPELYAKRIEEYTKRTLPILDGLKKEGYTILEIDGEQKPYNVFKDIQKELKAHGA